MGLQKFLGGFLVTALVAVAAPAVDAATITYSSNPGGATAPVLVGGVASSGSFDLTPGVGQTQRVWSYDLFFNPQSNFSDVAFDLDLTLNGVTHAIAFLASATAGGGRYTFVQNGTTVFDLAGIGLVEVTGLSVVTSISDPRNAGPTQANFYLVPTLTAVPLPASLALLGSGVAGLALVRRRKTA